MNYTTTTEAPEILLRRIEEVQATLRCSRSMVYALIAEGKLTSIKLRNATRVTDASVRALVADAIKNAP